MSAHRQIPKLNLAKHLKEIHGGSELRDDLVQSPPTCMETEV